MKGALLGRTRREAGQAVVEYMIILTITFGTILYFTRTMTRIFDTASPKMGGKIEVQLRAGAAPASLWKR